MTARYFRAGADKVSIGGDAVFAAERFLADGVKTGKSSIELISKLVGLCCSYGRLLLDPSRSISYYL